MVLNGNLGPATEEKNFESKNFQEKLLNTTDIHPSYDLARQILPKLHRLQEETAEHANILAKLLADRFSSRVYRHLSNFDRMTR